MGHYYFDIDDGERSIRDVTGVASGNLNDVRNEAIGLLPDLAGAIFVNGEHRVVVVQVRDQFDRVIFRASLAMDTEIDEWLTTNRQSNELRAARH